MAALNTEKLQLQDRDLALLRGLFECRVMTQDHAAKIFFEGKTEATKKRLQKLKAAKLIADRPRSAFQRSILFLTRNGIALLKENGNLDNYPAFDLPLLDRRARVSELTIRHELEVMDVKTAFHAAIKSAPAFQISTFSTWPLLNEFKAFRPGFNANEVLLKPDGFVRIVETVTKDEKFTRTFFLEVDRSSETQDVLVGKAGCYYDYYKSGGFALRNRASREDYKQFPFRVLMVFKTAERRNNTAERLLQSNLPIGKQFCLTTFDEVTRDPLGAIWIRLFEYRDATKGTPFEPDSKQPAWQYKRQAEREAFIENKIPKRRILTEE